MSNQCLEHAFAKPSVLLGEATPLLADVDYDTLVGVGMSGALVVPTLAHGLDKKMLIVRKPGDSHHHKSWDGIDSAEGHFGRHWVFVDDGIATGSTLMRAIRVVDQVAVAQNGPFGTPRFKGAYLYGHGTMWAKPQFMTPSEIQDYLGVTNLR